MLKRDITYETFDGEKITETFYFHLSKVELIELEGRYEGGLEGMLRRIMTTKDTKTILAEFKRIILSSYGQKSADGRHFVKSDELRKELEQSPVLDILYMEFLQEEDAAANFMKGIMPAGLEELGPKAPNGAPIPPPPTLQPAENIKR